MNNDIEIFGCFVSQSTIVYGSEQAMIDKSSEQGKLFRTYIWGEKGIDRNLKQLKHKDYGEDLKLILFEFYINPLPIELEGLKSVQAYRKKEKSIGIAIIVTDENFFSKSDDERYSFFKQTILQKLDILAEVIKKKKLDTKIELLKSDLQRILNF